jgi:hypothetical protein
MSLYILNENQKIIWDSMNKIPQFQMYGKDIPGKREEWFRNIIQSFYESNKFKLLSVPEVQQLNRETVSYMIQEIKTQQSYTSTFPSSELERKSVTRDYISEKKQDELNRAFSERQQEYGAILTRNPVKEIDFRIDVETGPIQNIDELVKKQIESRDADFTAYTDSNSLNNPIHLNVIDLSDSSVGEKKSVHWSSESAQPRGILKNVPSRQDDLQNFMKDIQNSVRAIQNEIDVLKRSSKSPMQIADPEVLQNPNVSNILSRLRKSNDSNQGYSSCDLIDPTSRIMPRNQIYMEQSDEVNSAFT